jgi:hypothetical protein
VSLSLLLLLLPVMYIWSDFISAREFVTLDLHLNLGQAKPSKPPREECESIYSSLTCGEGVQSHPHRHSYDGLLCFSTVKYPLKYVERESISRDFSCRLKINHTSPWKPCIFLEKDVVVNRTSYLV